VEHLDVEISAFRERRRNSPLRGVAVNCLLKYAGLTQREAADYLEMAPVQLRVSSWDD
jgi:hypothetical protein